MAPVGVPGVVEPDDGHPSLTAQGMERIGVPAGRDGPAEGVHDDQAAVEVRRAGS